MKLLPALPTCVIGCLLLTVSIGAIADSDARAVPFSNPQYLPPGDPAAARWDVVMRAGEVNQEAVRRSQSAWITDRGMHVNAWQLTSALANSTAHGLNPEAYGLSGLRDDIGRMLGNSQRTESLLHSKHAKERMRLERKLSKALAMLMRDLGRGVTNAKALQSRLYRDQPDVAINVNFRRLKAGEISVSDLLTEVTPAYSVYTELVNHMRSLLAERESNGYRTRVSLGLKVSPGEAIDGVNQLKQRLRETGDLDENTFDNNYFSVPVIVALKSVQARHGLKQTGELTKETINALNATVDDDIESVALSLERLRWMPRELGVRHVMMNIPSYNVRLMEGDATILEMPVVVGSTKHQTPVFSEDIRYVEVAPTWTVPPSITNRELIPLERRKPGYLSKARFDFFKWKNGQMVKVPATTVTPEDLAKKKFPYTLRQRAGKKNALGQLKIMMPNKYAIYFHDTQAKSLFAHTDRAYSHGCIRLSEPFKMASTLLKLDGLSDRSVKRVLAKKDTTRQLFRTRTPAHLAYYTSWIGEDGKLQKRKDVYNHNPKLTSALLASNTLISALQERQRILVSQQDDF